jgi:hypothetical protein
MSVQSEVENAVVAGDDAKLEQLLSEHEELRSVPEFAAGDARTIIARNFTTFSRELN